MPLRKTLLFGGLLFAGLLFVGCDGEDDSLCNVDPQVLESSQLTTTGSGLQFADLVEGEGEPAATGDSVSVHYIGWLADGTQFDCSYDRGSPYNYTIGGSLPVIEGWEEGLVGVREGGERHLVIPPELGYGPDGNRFIPPNATLIFEIEMVDIFPAPSTE